MNRTIRLQILCGLCVLLLAAVGCASPSRHTTTPSVTEQPAQPWPTSSPEEQGLDAALLDEMATYIEDQSLKLHSLLVIRHGVIVDEQYYGSFTATGRYELYSCTKSFTSTLIGIALDKGLLSDIDQPVLDFFADRSFENFDERKQAMTIEDVLTMTPGLEWDEGDATYSAMYRSSDWVAYVLDKPMEFQPGIQFEYNSGASHVLSAVIQQSTGMNTRDFAQENLFDSLGITDVRWDTDSSGLSIGGWGLQLAPREMARLGLLFLHQGQWDGEQIVSADWVETATQKHVPTDGDLGYGYQWWIDARNDGYAALGRYGQTIYVHPGCDLVVVTTAREEDHEEIFKLINTYILPACSTD